MTPEPEDSYVAPGDPVIAAWHVARPADPSGLFYIRPYRRHKKDGGLFFMDIDTMLELCRALIKGSASKETKEAWANTLLTGVEACRNTDAVTGLPNYQAYEEAGDWPVHVSLDVVERKWVFDLLGRYALETAMAMVFAAYARETGIKAYRFFEKGMDGAAVFQDEPSALAAMGQLAGRFRRAVFRIEWPDGTSEILTGLTLAYGIGPNKQVAHGRLNGHRAALGKTPIILDLERREQAGDLDRQRGSTPVVTAEAPMRFGPFRN